MPFFSIIIPVYNGAPYLRPCLDSILAQSFTDWECICVDDGSTDGAGEILDEYAARDNRFRVIHKKNEGVSVARNKALKQANGEYVCFVDGDDLVDSSWLKDYSMAIESSDADVIKLNRRGANVGVGPIVPSDLTEWLWKVLVDDGYPWGYALRRNIAVKVGFPSGVAMSEDAVYLMRVVPLINSAYQMGSCGYRHIYRNESAMRRKLTSEDRYNLLSAIYSSVSDCKIFDCEIVSGFVAGAIMSWLDRPLDFCKKSDIRMIWLKLRDIGCAKSDRVRLAYRLQYVFYGVSGFVWSIRLSSALFKSILAIRRSIRRKVRV